MHPILKCLLVLVGAGGLAVVGTFFALFTAGPTVAAGERAVLSLGVLDLLLALAGCGALVWASSGLDPWPRWLSVIGGTLALLLFLFFWMLMTIILFNR
jgi:hypothetical protein